MSAALSENSTTQALSMPAPVRGEKNRTGLNSVERQEFVNAMAGAVTGVTVVTTAGVAGRYGLTVSAVVSVSADPPMVLACINRRSPAGAAVRENRAFCVNILSIEQRHVAETFSGRPTRGTPYEFSTADWTPGVTGTPRLVNAVSSFDCVLETAHVSGSHIIFIGRVVAVCSGGGRPLLYTHRRYGEPCSLN